MTDLAFYNAGCQEPRGLRRVLVFARRGLRRILRPIFQRQVELFQALCDRLDAAERADASLRDDLNALAKRHDNLNAQMQTAMAFGWDYVAMVRRLSVLEDRVETLIQTSGPTANADDARPSSVPFPDAKAEAC